MFKEEVTQYCPMCEEWAEKYKQLDNEYEGFAVKYTDMEIALKTKEQECIKIFRVQAKKHEENTLLKQQIDQLEEKNEQLKTCYKNNLEVLRHEEKVNNNLTDRVMKAEQALQEIRQVVEFAMEEVLTIGQRNATAKILEILQKCEVIK